MAREAFPLVNATNGHGSQLELTWLLCTVAFSMAFNSIIIFACGKSGRNLEKRRVVAAVKGVILLELAV
ncbi:hypothetical protein NL676_000995 [Syzygium grande]|nr:hypothetical protein NL676_000995 [Syzygium grande]